MTKKPEVTVTKSSKIEDLKHKDKVVVRSEDLCTAGKDPICYKGDDLTNLDGDVIGTDISFESDEK
jgi:uncharacterized protein (DUF779 family)